MEDIEIGKKIVLRPIITDSEFKPPLPYTKKLNKIGKPSEKKRIAQLLYYRNKNQSKQNNVPVQLRLGGPIQKRHGFLKMFNDENFIKPRIRKSNDGLTTEKFRKQRAQQRIVEIRRLHQMSLKHFVIMAPANKTSKYPPILHSIVNSLNPDLQMEIKAIMQNCVRSNDVENELPFHSEDATSITMHKRFSSLP